jgi:GTP-binding protein
MKSFDLMFGAKNGSWISQQFMVLQKTTGCDHWENVTDNVEALLDMVINVPCSKVSEGTPQMLITSLDFSAFTGRIAIGRLERGVLKEGMPISLVKRDGFVSKSRIKELHTFEGLESRRSNC